MEKNAIIKELNKSTKFKIMYFLENNIEPNVLYKKISFSNEELYMSFDSYIVKKMEYKLRTFCQVAEKLGAERIKIQYDSKILEKSSLNLELSGPRNGTGASISQTNETNNTVNMDFEYTNYYYNTELQDPNNSNIFKYDTKKICIHRTGHLLNNKYNGVITEDILADQFNRLEEVINKQIITENAHV